MQDAMRLMPSRISFWQRCCHIPKPDMPETIRAPDVDQIRRSLNPPDHESEQVDAPEHSYQHLLARPEERFAAIHHKRLSQLRNPIIHRVNRIQLRATQVTGYRTQRWRAFSKELFLFRSFG